MPADAAMQARLAEALATLPDALPETPARPAA